MHRMEEARHGAIEAGAEWAKVNGDYKALKEMMPTILAEIQRITFTGGKMTMAVAKMEALANPKYREKVEEMNRLNKESNLLETRYRAFLESIKAIAAISYVKNQEMKLSA